MARRTVIASDAFEVSVENNYKVTISNVMDDDASFVIADALTMDDLIDLRDVIDAALRATGNYRRSASKDDDK